MDLSEEVSSAQTLAVEIAGSNIAPEFDGRGPQPEVSSMLSNTSTLSKSLARTTVLVNEDILDIVFSFFDPAAFFNTTSHVEPSTRKALYSAALTCKSFFNPATTLLWRVMESVIPVLKILPTFVKINDIYTITPGIASEDLERLAFYARKVRYLYLKTFRDTIRSHAILRLINLNTPTSSIFPALTVLYIPSLECRRNIENLSVIFLAPVSLTTLYIDAIDSSTEDVISSFLSVLGQREVPIQDLMLAGCLTPSSLSLVQNFRKLQVLNLAVLNGTLHSKFLRVWGRLANLTHLILDLDTTSTFDFGDPNRIEGFDTLQELRLWGLPAEISKILESIQESKTLMTISLSTVSSLTWSQLESLSAISVSNCIMECGRMSPSLRHLNLVMPTARKDLQVPQKALTPLASCKQLESFELVGVSLPINDDDIRELCANDKWSKIQVLHLPAATIDHAPSLSSLQILARHCPNLANLTICVDLRLHDDRSLQRERSGPRMPHKLKQLSIIKLPTGSDTNTTEMGISVSRFIEYHFPYLKEAKFVSDAAGDAKWWKGVKAMINEYQTIRAEMRSEFVEAEN